MTFAVESNKKTWNCKVRYAFVKNVENLMTIKNASTRKTFSENIYFSMHHKWFPHSLK